MFLIFGRTGWIGGLVGQYLKEQGAKFEYASCRLEDRAAVLAEIERVSLRYQAVVVVGLRTFVPVLQEHCAACYMHAKAGHSTQHACMRCPHTNQRR